MNLLLDKWIPVIEKQILKRISLQDVLCGKCDDDVTITLSRDDMEFAALQLIISICQSIFLPENENELKQRIDNPISEAEYQKFITPYKEWFDLFHNKYPFMQAIEVHTVKKEPISISIQNILPGLPAETSHVFFNSAKEVEKICPSCTAIALFNQAANAPSFGGGFKYGLRNVPITAFIQGDNLRATIWNNILPKDFGNLPQAQDNNEPVWVKPITDSKIDPSQIGLLRGLFWQPAKIKLSDKIVMDKKNTCMLCGIETDTMVASFIRKQFNFEVEGYWNHPHSSKIITLKKKKEKPESVISAMPFNNSNPTWTYLPGLLYQVEINAESREPAATIRHYYDNNDKAYKLMVGGYVNKQAKIKNRRHDTRPISISPIWKSKSENPFSSLGDTLKEVKQFVEKLKSVCIIKCGENKINLKKRAIELFYQRTESDIYNIIKNVHLKKKDEEKRELFKEISKITKKIFQEVTFTYRHKPEYLVEILNNEHKLNKNIGKLLKEENPK
ncbi:MAG: type I-E CRISPR-associated protein Cse1/CasA [Endomicrobium sp.]|jgi:CRISPR system Cascade subunit CasA|nr:type I-E CRISPR-associated protein Cse1/CasA [Endomicrobium sp.]